MSHKKLIGLINYYMVIQVPYVKCKHNTILITDVL